MWAEAQSAAASSRTQVVAALQQAAAATGSDFHYLLSTAMRESGLKPQAQSSTSSASGLFQFVDQTWLGLVKKYGAQEGFGNAANAITQDSAGHYRVADNADRQAILALRNDPKVASMMEGHYAQETKSSLEGTLGRSVGDGELYAAHFLGTNAACKLIQLNQSNPQGSAASAFPQAASANRSVFFHSDGSAKSVREVCDWAAKPGSVGADTGALALRTTPVEEHETASYDVMGQNAWAYRSMMGDSASSLMAMTSPLSLSSDVIDLLGSLAPDGEETSRFGQTN
jgi:Transglycosylase SLT domain